MSYESELEFATQLLVALEYIAEQCIDHQEEYPLLTRDIFHLIYGVVVQIECPECENTLQAEETVGGLDCIFDYLEETIQALEAELIFEAPTFVYPADYSI